MTLRIVLALALALAALWLLAPREPARLGPVALDLPEDLVAFLAVREAGIAPADRAYLRWAGAPGATTDLAVVVLHGFSAGVRETAPLPEAVARGLGANLFVQRLAGHGQDGAALARASVADWWRDTAEAIAIGRRIGRRVLLIGTSTGGTLAAEAARDPALGPALAGVVLISPNFRLRNPAGRLLTWPLARVWVPLVAGRERCFAPLNADHGAAWTTCYPTTALLPMAALVARAARGGYAAAGMPLLVIQDPGDTVVDPEAARDALAHWAGPVTLAAVEAGPGDDPMRHVIAGDILSPDLTPRLRTRILDWAGEVLR